ncbi:hypothetical protein BYT27DRAFT_7162678 [Phlegmacium glaucopus]|nr:hypothetical protein BYT27DRAFT_7162678 [Phlegmacium glaucopus]
MKLKLFPCSRPPSNWPLHRNNKCSKLTCIFSNQEQAVEGTYNCQGYRPGRRCEGTYYVSFATAEEFTKNCREREKKLEIWAKLNAAEIERRKIDRSLRDDEERRFAVEELAAKFEERSRNKDPSTGFTSHDLPFSAYVENRAAQRRGDPKPTDHITKQRHASPTYNQVHDPPLCPPAMNSYYKAPVDQRHSKQLPQLPGPQTLPRSHKSKPITKNPPPSSSYGYKSPYDRTRITRVRVSQIVF